jgi:hypothetical protein
VVFERLREITAVDPAIAGWAADEMLGLVLWRIADANAQIFAARDHLLMTSKNN